MYARYLKKRFPLYLLSGFLFASLLGATLATWRYNSDLGKMIEKVHVFDQKRAMILLEIREIDNRTRQLKKLLPSRAARSSGQEMILWGLDRLRERVGEQALTIGDPNDSGNEVALPVEMDFPFETHALLIRRVDSLEREIFPFFEIDSLIFVKGPDGRAACTVKGRLVAPGEAQEV